MERFNNIKFDIMDLLDKIKKSKDGLSFSALVGKGDRFKVASSLKTLTRGGQIRCVFCKGKPFYVVDKKGIALVKRTADIKKKEIAAGKRNFDARIKKRGQIADEGAKRAAEMEKIEG